MRNLLILYILLSGYIYGQSEKKNDLQFLSQQNKISIDLSKEGFWAETADSITTLGMYCSNKKNGIWLTLNNLSLKLIDISVYKNDSSIFQIIIEEDSFSTVQKNITGDFIANKLELKKGVYPLKTLTNINPNSVKSLIFDNSTSLRLRENQLIYGLPKFGSDETYLMFGDDSEFDIDSKSSLKLKSIKQIQNGLANGEWYFCEDAITFSRLPYTNGWVNGNILVNRLDDGKELNFKVELGKITTVYTRDIRKKTIKKLRGKLKKEYLTFYLPIIIDAYINEYPLAIVNMNKFGFNGYYGFNLSEKEIDFLYKKRNNQQSELNKLWSK